MVEGTVLFIRYVFNEWPFRKLYVEVPAFNLPQFRSARSLLVEEACFHDHEYHEGKWWHLHIFAIYPGVLLTRYPSLAKALMSQPWPATDIAEQSKSRP